MSQSQIAIAFRIIASHIEYRKMSKNIALVVSGGRAQVVVSPTVRLHADRGTIWHGGAVRHQGGMCRGSDYIRQARLFGRHVAELAQMRPNRVEAAWNGAAKRTESLRWHWQWNIRVAGW